MKRTFLSIVALLSLAFVTNARQAQQRSFEVHKRGMLHESIFNTGEIGRAYDQGGSGSIAGQPSFEWPGNSAQIVDGKSYNGQYNSLGGGVYLGVNASDSSARWYALCGGIGSSSTEIVWGRYSFPLGLQRVENYPLLPDGTVNPAYRRSEAEEVITSKWATNTGITVTRTSRAWSNPDYDDFIIYEYEMENTGDRNGDGFVESVDTLREVFVCFMYSLTPSMFGYERKMNRWRGSDYELQSGGLGMQRARFDRRRWLNYAENTDGSPDPVYYNQWAASGEHGGGLNSPQAVGYVMLHIDTTYLATPGQTTITNTLSATQAAAIWGPNNHPKQPLVNRLHSSAVPSVKPTTSSDGIMDVLYVYRANKPITDSLNYPPEWIGRGSFNWRQSQKFAVSRFMVQGPYILPHGAKIRFALAEVAGYGAAHRWQTDAGMKDEGGSCGETCGEASFAGTPYAFNPVWNWDTTLAYGGISTTPAYTYGSTHLSHAKLPDYVNSNVVTVREVADRAIQAYLGGPVVSYDSAQFWPENTPDRGVYDVPNSVISPIFTVQVDSLPRNLLTWGNDAEAFIGGTFSNYEIYRSPSAIGPWTKIDSVGKSDPRWFSGGTYRVEDRSPRIGEYFYYSVVSVDTAGMRSPKNNVLLQETQQRSNNADGSKEIYVVPNPLLVRSGYSGASNPESRVCFMNLPPVCTIRIYSYSGQLVNTIDHTSGASNQAWYQVTRNDQQTASGLYFYVVDVPGGKRTHGKLVIIR